MPERLFAFFRVRLINILYLAIEFAPVNTTGNYRSTKFVKYLPEFGIKPIVVTLDIPSALQVFPSAAVDNSLLEDLPKDTSIIRIPCKKNEFDLQNRMVRFLRAVSRDVGDEFQTLWKENLLSEIGGIVSKYQPRLIIASLPPFGTGPLAVEISKRFDLPLILDMRDGWTFWNPAPYPTFFNYYRERKILRRIFKQAKAILGVTHQLNDAFRQFNPGINPEKFHVIPNGFDGPEINGEAINIPRLSKNEYVIGYVGAFYYVPKYTEEMAKPWWQRKGHRKFYFSPRKENYLYRTPHFFFKALSELFKRRPDMRKIVKLKFVGEKPDWMDEMASSFGFQDLCSFYGRMPRLKALKILGTCDAFLNTTTKIEGGKDYSLNAKLFDYILMKKPILGFILNGAAKDFLENSGLGFVFDPDKAYGSSLLLEKAIDGGYTLKPNSQYLNQFHRHHLTRQLAEVIKNQIN